MNVVRLHIGGEDVDAARGTSFTRANPVTGTIATTAAAAGIDDVRAAIDAAHAAFGAWSATGPGTRRRLLQQAAANLRARAAEFGRLCTEETGAVAAWGGFNATLAAGMIDEAAAMTTRIAGETIPSDHAGTLAMSVRRAAGVCVGMAPWNAPVILGVRAIAMPLACGNTVVFKASELSPAVHRAIIDAFVDAGFPPGVVNFVSHAAADAPAVVEALIAHDAVRRVSFTGSTRVGRIVGELCGRHLKRCLLELGGKSPLVVLDDADLDAAVAAAAFGAFMHQGQICMSTERIIVGPAIADEFVRRFAAKAATLRVGDPAEGQFPIGACVDEKTVAHVEELVADAVAQGATVVAGGRRLGRVFFEPTVVDGVRRGVRLYGEESFGPIVGIVRARDVDHAVELANDTDYGLSGAVFGRDVSTALDVAQRIDSGICHVNGPTVQDEAQMPFGGTRASGFGRFGGTAAIDEFTELRWLTISTRPRRYPI